MPVTALPIKKLEMGGAGGGVQSTPPKRGRWHQSVRNAAQNRPDSSWLIENNLRNVLVQVTEHFGYQNVQLQFTEYFVQ